MTKTKGKSVAGLAFTFVLTIGIVNLFADMTYEGGRSITGPFLESLGASALAVSVIAGGGELLGYTLRSVAGYVADKTQRYWWVVLTGYVINMIAVPALALAGKAPALQPATYLSASDAPPLQSSGAAGGGDATTDSGDAEAEGCTRCGRI